MLKNKRKQIILFVIIILATIILNNFYEINKSKMLLAVYSKYNCNVVQANVSNIFKLKENLETYEQMKTKTEDILLQLGIKSVVQVDENENDIKKEYIATKNSEESETIIKIISNKDNKNKVYETNLFINIILYDKIENVGYIQKLFEDMENKLGLKGKMNITIVGNYDGDIGEKERIATAEKIFRSLKSKIVDSFKTDKIYSAYGYTNYIKDSVDLNGKKVNTNLAIRYNSYENKTYLYLSSPIITTEY